MTTPRFNIAVTATRDGLTKNQRELFIVTMGVILGELSWQSMPDVWFHHGDCVGGDADAHDAVQDVIKPRMGGLPKIAVHPPKKPDDRAFKTGDFMYPEKGYIQRNEFMADMANVLIGMPRGPIAERPPYGGTWRTILYAREIKIPRLFIIMPDGLHTEERFER